MQREFENTVRHHSVVFLIGALILPVFVIDARATDTSAAEKCESSEVTPSYVDATMKEHYAFALKYLMPALHTGQLGELVTDPMYSSMADSAEKINERMINIISSQLRTKGSFSVGKCNFAELARRLRDVRALLTNIHATGDKSPATLRDFNERSVRYLSYIDQCNDESKNEDEETETKQNGSDTKNK